MRGVASKEKFEVDAVIVSDVGRWIFVPWRERKRVFSKYFEGHTLGAHWKPLFGGAGPKKKKWFECVN